MPRVRSTGARALDESPPHMDEMKRIAVALRLAILQDERAAYFNLGQMLEGAIVLQSPEEIARGVVEKQRQLTDIQRQIRSVDPSWE